MNLSFHIDEQSKYKLDQIIKIYRRPSGVEDSLDTRFYLESQEVVKLDDKIILSESKPFKQETLNNLSNFLHGREQSSLKGFIPKNLLYQDPTIGNKTFIWFRESKRTYLRFSNGKKLPADSWIHLPTLVFKANNKNLSVWAVKTKKASINSSLYKAPLLNVTDGRICLGTTRRIIESEIDAINDINDLIEYWEQMLFSSEFNTGDGECKDSISGKKHLITYLSELSKKQQKFNNDLLVPCNTKLKNLINDY